MRVFLRAMAEVKRMCRVTARATTAFVGALLKRKMKAAKNAEPPVNQTILNHRVVTQWVHYGAMGIS